MKFKPREKVILSDKLKLPKGFGGYFGVGDFVEIIGFEDSWYRVKNKNYDIETFLYEEEMVKDNKLNRKLYPNGKIVGDKIEVMNEF